MLGTKREGGRQELWDGEVLVGEGGLKVLVRAWWDREGTRELQAEPGAGARGEGEEGGW